MSKFGQYQLLERVAVGGMGEVYRARSLGEEGFEKPVAIKHYILSSVGCALIWRLIAEG